MTVIEAKASMPACGEREDDGRGRLLDENGRPRSLGRRREHRAGELTQRVIVLGVAFRGDLQADTPIVGEPVALDLRGNAVAVYGSRRKGGTHLVDGAQQAREQRGLGVGTNLSAGLAHALEHLR